MTQWAIAKVPTPLLNTPHFCFEGPLENGLLRSVETVLFPGTIVQLLEEVGNCIFKAHTEEYPYPPCFVDVRFLELKETKPQRKKGELPSKEEFLMTLRGLEGAKYIWGGCWPKGIPELSSLYPNPVHQFEGVDCSGLVRFASKGLTPHRTSVLLNYGSPVEIEETLEKLQSGDLIVWKGHVIVVLDKEHSIESIYPEGVVISELKERFKKLPQGFVVRRFLTF